MFGTDWPHQVHDTKGAFANSARLPEDQTSAIRSTTAQRIFGL
jgi:aminocarboxymuconate-semialdehyde decarboxylase